MQASRERLIALPARTSILPVTKHLLWVHSWWSNWRLSDLSTNVAATSTPPKRKCRDSKEGAWVIQAGACIPLARTTWAFMLRWIAQRCWASVQGPVKVTMMCLVRDRQRTSRPDAQRRDIPLRVLNGPGGPLVHPSLLDYAPGKEGLHEFMRIRPIAIIDVALQAFCL